MLLAFQEAERQAAACGPSGEQGVLCRLVFDITDNERAAEIADAFAVPVRIALIILGAYLVIRVARFLIRRAVRRLRDEQVGATLQQVRRRSGLALLDTSPEMESTRRAQRAETMGAALRYVVTILVWFVAGILILDSVNVDLAPLVAGAGIAGVALGFGAQAIVRDFLAGTFMIMEDQFGVGDVIDVGDAAGTVENVSLRTTRLRDVGGTVWHVPNGQITRVGNMSQQWSRTLLDLEVAYDTDIPAAIGVIKRTADELWTGDFSTVILAEPEVWGVEDLGASAVVIRVVIKTKPLEQWNVARALRARIKTAFDAAGIEIPFPQQTVTFRSREPEHEPAPDPDQQSDDA